MSERIVAKFGGTSLADAGQMRKVCQIVKSNPRRRYVVVSAPGKRTKNEQKITDLLLICQSMAAQQLDYSEPFRIIKDRYDGIARELEVQPLSIIFQETEAELRKLVNGDPGSLATPDWMAARGEFWNALLMAEFLDAVFVPSGECIRFDTEGLLDPVSYENYARMMADDSKLYVIPGFYGRDAKGNIKTFSRGGSDITGAVVARAVGAMVYENWTDVSGLLMADPRVLDNPKPIAEVTYRELRELAYMGAQVMHEETVFPASEAGIPILIKNTNSPQDPGTRIVAGRDATEGAIVGIAGRKGFSTIYIEKAMMNQQVGFGRQLLDILENHQVPFEHMPSAIDSMSLIISTDHLEKCSKSLLRDITDVLKPDRLEMLNGMALIATVGEGMSHRVGVAGTLFHALHQAEVNVRMISQGASEINIIVGVAEDDYERAVKAIYDAFVA